MQAPTFTGNWLYVNERPNNDFLPDSHYLRPEAALVACVISIFDNIEKIDNDIKDDYFQYPENKLFWRVLNKIKLDQKSLDLPIFFSEACEVFIADNEVDPPKELATACANLFTAECSANTQNVNFHTKKFLEEYMRREMAGTLRQKTPDAFTKGAKLQHELDRLMDLDKSKSANLFTPLDLAESMFDLMLDKENNPEKYRKLDWGYNTHNEKIPLSKGHLVIVGGRSGSGKTTYAMNLLRKQIIAGNSVAVFSLEMSKEELTHILISQLSQIPFEKFNKIEMLNDGDIDTITHALEIFKQTKSIFVETPNLSIEDVRRQSLQIKNRLGNLDAIFIDHIHIMGDGEKRFNSVREKIMHISAGLKNLAKELEVPIFALAQMNRNVEARQDKTPITADLKESGSLEQDADTIVFTFRGTDPNKPEDPYIICRKNRHGVVCDFKIPMIVNPTIKVFEEA